MLNSTGSAETKRMGRRLGEIVPGGTLIALNGELGAGKTVFAQGVGCGLGVRELLTSPSFVLMNAYRGRLELFHFDFYRLEGEDDLETLGLDEYFYGEGVVLVEWAEKFIPALPADRLEIRIARDEGGGEESRCLYIYPQGGPAQTLAKEWCRRCCC